MCKEGQYLKNGQCEDVGRGYYSPSQNNNRYSCTKGHYSNIENASACKACSNRPSYAISVSYASSSALTSNSCPIAEVTSCQSGYKISSDKKSCVKEAQSVLCRKGQYMSNRGCIDVGTGYYSPSQNNSRFPCASGRYSSLVNAASCSFCTNKPSFATQVTYASSTAKTSNSCPIAEVTSCQSGYKISSDKKSCVKQTQDSTELNLCAGKADHYYGYFSQGLFNIGYCENGHVKVNLSKSSKNSYLNNCKIIGMPEMTGSILYYHVVVSMASGIDDQTCSQDCSRLSSTSPEAVCVNNRTQVK